MQTKKRGRYASKRDPVPTLVAGKVSQPTRIKAGY